MPLSEQEQRLLEEMERNLYQNDADFVATVSQRRGKPNYSIIAIGVLVGLAGIGTLITGVVIAQPLIGVLGFAIMFAGVLIALTPPRSFKAGKAAGAQPGAARPKATQRSGSFMDNLNDRWDKRQGDRG
jgi:hypothetical protein